MSCSSLRLGEDGDRQVDDLLRGGTLVRFGGRFRLQFATFVAGPIEDATALDSVISLSNKCEIPSAATLDIVQAGTRY
jgi:hypothetical protein